MFPLLARIDSERISGAVSRDRTERRRAKASLNPHEEPASVVAPKRSSTRVGPWNAYCTSLTVFETRSAPRIPPLRHESIACHQSVNAHYGNSWKTDYRRHHRQLMTSGLCD